jgi:orotidine-5'-phosphate decarboxylase
VEPFADRLITAVRAKGNAVAVGIDPHLENLPPGFLDDFEPTFAGRAAAVEAYGRAVVDVVAPLVPVVKLQAAFYEALGPAGVAAQHATAAHARRQGMIVIVDGKRNDIGSTAEAYARAYLGRTPLGNRAEAAWPADALTVNPYLGSDGIGPFIESAAPAGKGIFVLVRTSNPSAGEFQDLVAAGRPVYRHVAQTVGTWAEPHRGPSGYSLVGAVVGATYPEQLAELRRELPWVWFLVPGYGAQGGTARDVSAAFDENGLGALISSSRGVGCAYLRPDVRERSGNDWRAAVELAARAMIADLASVWG